MSEQLTDGHRAAAPGSPENALGRVVRALENMGCSVRWTHGRTALTAQCPAHEDKVPSLSIKEGPGGHGVLLHDFGGCATEAVVDALKLRMSDLFDDGGSRRRVVLSDRPRRPAGSAGLGGRTTAPPKTLVCNYVYDAADGTPVLRVQRWRLPDGKKTFTQQHQAGGMWANGGVASDLKVLYRLPELRAAAAAGQEVWLTEGEKDADRLMQAGVPATTCAGGAKAPWLDQYSEALRGVSRVIIVADKDDAGRDAARTRCDRIRAMGTPVEIVEAAQGKDAFDHLEADLGLGEFVPVVPVDRPSDPDLDPTIYGADVEGASTELFSGNKNVGRDERVAGISTEVLGVVGLMQMPKPVPLVEGALFRRTYGLLVGRDGTMKSFVALDWCLCLATGLPWQGRPTAGPARILYMAAEGAHGLGVRVKAWEVAHDVRIPEGRLLVLPRAVNMFRSTPEAKDDRDDLLRYVADGGFDLVVVDTLRRVSGGADGNGSDMGTVIDNLDTLKRATVDGTLLVVAHTGKEDKDTRGFSGIEDDADFVWHASRSGNDSSVALHLTKWKDGQDGTAVTLNSRVMSWPEGDDCEAGSSLVLEESEDRRDGFGLNGTERLVLEALQGNTFGDTGATSAQLVGASGRSTSAVYKAFKKLAEPGGPVIAYDGPRKLRHFRLRREDDD